MPCKIEIDGSKLHDVLGIIGIVSGGKGEKLIENALKAEADVVKPSIEKEAPRSTRKRTGKWAKKGHMADHIKISDVLISRVGAYYIAIGPQLKPHDGYAYAPLVEYGTSRMKANPFVDRAAEQAGDRATDAAIEALRKGMGLT